MFHIIPARNLFRYNVTRKIEKKKLAGSSKIMMVMKVPTEIKMESSQDVSLYFHHGSSTVELYAKTCSD